MSLAVITDNNPSPALDKRFQEVALVARALDLAESAIRGAGGQSASGTITDAGGDARNMDVHRASLKLNAKGNADDIPTND